ncbi:MAG: histidine triad nucleotide-binding protein [Ruminococcaceae bacterium]|nr:histidine triad nucleotide-binding protein [Oscillospiraceae bacterium]
MSDCIFCKIIKGDIPSQKVYEDELVYAFRDIAPAAPVHVLIVPKEHLCCLNAAKPEHQALLGHILLTAQKLAEDLGVKDDGYRIINNCGENAGQTVFHLHFHLLAGDTFSRLV